MAKKKNNILIIAIVIIAGIFLINQFGFFETQAISGSEYVRRSISPTQPKPGDLITVTLSYSGGNEGITVHEEAPSDINYNTVTGTSLFGGTGNVLEYFLGTQAQITLPASSVTYKITAGSEGAYSFSGYYSLEGSANKAITGVTSFNVVSCQPSCTRPSNMCTQASSVSDGCGGTCSGSWTVSKNTNADSNCDNIVSWTEINSAIQSWLSGSYSWTEINNIVQAWLGG